MKTVRYLLITALVMIGIIWLNTQKEPQDKFAQRDYADILSSKVLRAVTEYNSISYHVDGDTIKGFDYEILQIFAHEKGMKLEITPEMSFEKRLKGVCEGRYDLLATGTTITTTSKDSLLFTRPILLNKQVLIQRKPKKENDSSYIKGQLELAHKTLYVTKNSPALLRIHNLIEEIADTIYIREVELYGAEQLISMVAAGDIDYAVCDEYIARAFAQNYTNLDINTDIGFTQFYAWGIGKHAPILRDSLNSWLQDYQKSNSYKKLYKKYF